MHFLNKTSAQGTPFHTIVEFREEAAPGPALSRTIIPVAKLAAKPIVFLVSLGRITINYIARYALLQSGMTMDSKKVKEG